MGYETANPTAIKKSSCRNLSEQRPGVWGVQADILFHPFIIADKLKEANKN